MEEKMKIRDKIHDSSTNLGKNPLLTLLLHVVLFRNAPSLSKNQKNSKKNEEDPPKMREKLFIWLELSVHA